METRALSTHGHFYCLPSWFPAGYSDCYPEYRERAEGDIATYIPIDTAFSLSLSFSTSIVECTEKHRFRVGDEINRRSSGNTMTRSQFYNRANKGDRDSLLKFSQTFMAERKYQENLRDLYVCYTMKDKNGNLFKDGHKKCIIYR